MARVILVTGVSRYLGGRLAKALASDPGVDRVIGVDVVPPLDDIGSVDFVRAGIEHPVIARIIKNSAVDTVVHMNVIATPLGPAARAARREINVIGSMQLLAACQRSESVRQLVVKSSASVYGVSPNDPAVFTEEMEPIEVPRTGFAKDSIDVEGYVRTFARHRRDVKVALLRFANVMGAGMDTPMTRYFSLPVIPTVLGYDARIQLTHEADVISAIQRATSRKMSGTFNVAADGVLMLSQAVARAGRPNLPVPAPLASVTRDITRRLRYIDFTAEQIGYLKYGRVIDTQAFCRTADWRPQFTTTETFDSFVLAHAGDPTDVREASHDVNGSVTFLEHGP